MRRIFYVTAGLLILGVAIYLSVALFVPREGKRQTAEHLPSR